MTDPIVLAESILAVTGTGRIICKAPRPPTQPELNRAAKFRETMRKRVAELIASPTQGKQSNPPELPDYKFINGWMANYSAEGAEESLFQFCETVPPELVPAVTMVVGSAIQHLSDRFPRRVTMDLTGPRLCDPSPGEWAEWGWSWRIANEPAYALDLAGDGMLIGAEVVCLKTMFPALYAEICGDVQDELTNRRSSNDDWSPPWWLAKQLCTILGVSPVSRTLLADIDAAVKASQDETKTRASALKLTNQGGTQIQRLTEGTEQK
jgi:hypothetical protein